MTFLSQKNTVAKQQQQDYAEDTMIPKGAIVFPGCAMNKKSAEPLVHLAESTTGRVDKVIPFPSAINMSDKELAILTKDRPVFEYSAGSIMTSKLRMARMAVVLCGIEHTHPATALARAPRVAYNALRTRNGEKGLSALNGAIDLLTHPRYLEILSHIGKFSTAHALIEVDGGSFPEGSYILPAKNDHFGFYNEEKLSEAVAAGIEVGSLDGNHTYPLTHPARSAAILGALIERHATALRSRIA